MHEGALNSSVAPGDGAILRQVLEDAGRLIVGKQETLRLALTCLLAGGHLLIEDVPGVGKTTLAHLLARLVHPNLPRVIDTFFVPGQGQYLVMDYIDGEDLRQRMERVGTIEEEDRAVRALLQAAGGPESGLTSRGEVA